MQSKQVSAVPLIAGATAGAVEAFVTYPTEYVKTVSQMSGRTGLRMSPVEVMKNTWQQQGVTGFYQACTPVIAGNALKAGTRFFTYEAIRNLLRGQDGKLSPYKTMLSGVAAGVVESVVAVTPSESIKTRVIEAGRMGTGQSGSLSTIRTMLRDRSQALQRDQHSVRSRGMNNSCRGSLYLYKPASAA